jgi:replicative DNA helicase
MKSKNDSQRSRLPPQNIEAEASLLSAILIDNRILDDIVDVLTSKDFYRSAHQIIFRAMIELVEKREPIDLVTLTNILKDKGDLETVSGAIYLAKLIDEVPLAVNAGHYAKIIHDKATLRRLIEKGYAIIKNCFDDQENVDEIVDYAESCIFEISEKKIKPSFYEVKDLLKGGFENLEMCEKNKGIPTGVPTGFKQLDSLTSGFQNSDLIILAARPSMGKTAFALNIARNAAVDSNIPVAFFSLEMAKEQLVMRLLCSEARLNVTRLRDGFITKDDWEILNKAGSTLDEAPIYIDDSSDFASLSFPRAAKSPDGAISGKRIVRWAIRLCAIQRSQFQCFCDCIRDPMVPQLRPLCLRESYGEGGPHPTGDFPFLLPIPAGSRIGGVHSA